jgi:hypothetical protein
MSFLFWFRPGHISPCRRRGARRRPATRVPTLELLEDRSLPSLFGPPTLFRAGSEPLDVAVGDFNGDGIPDLVVTNVLGGKVSVLLGDGHGGFGKATSFTVGQFPEAVAVGDLNGDGVPDLAVANQALSLAGTSGSVSVLLGNGHGGFSPAVNIPLQVGASPNCVVVGNFTSPGTLDIAVGEDNGTVDVLLGTGTGTFRTPSTYTVSPVAIRALAVGDFNGDGRPDLVTANSTFGTGSSVTVLLGMGSGAFGNRTTYLVGKEPASVAVGDFNGDGIPDLAVANAGDGSVSVLLGDGHGGFSPAASSPFPVGAYPNSVAVADFNRDGIPDLAVANWGGHSVSVLLGDGHGGFSPAAGSPFPIGSAVGPAHLAVGDFNGDGAPDVVATSPINPISTVEVLLNQTPVTTTSVASSTSPAVAGQLVTYTATVTAAVPGQPVTPTGLVTFTDGSTVLGSGTLDGADQASFSTLAAGTGYHAITAVYQGDPNFTGSTSPPLNQLVNRGTTTTLLSASAGPALAGQPVVLTALVSPDYPTTGKPTGTVVFLDRVVETPTILGTATLSGGVATLTTAALAPGSHSLSAVYAGDNNFTGSTAAVLAETIDNPAPVLRGLDTTALPEGSAGFTLTLNGTGFLGSSVVQWNGTPLTATAASGTQIQVLVPAALLADEGTAQVTVTNPGPGGGPSLPQTFAITDALLAASGANISVLGNKSFSGAVATFTDVNPQATAAEFKAIIVWDDQTADFGTVSGPDANGVFTVSGSHTFATFSNVHTVAVTIYDKGGNTAAVRDNIIDPPGPPDLLPPAGGNPGAAAPPGVDPPGLGRSHHRRHGGRHQPTGAHAKRHQKPHRANEASVAGHNPRP